MKLVLALDDDSAAIAAVSRMLRNRHIRPLCLATAKEALEIVRAERPAVIVTVHRLPRAPHLLVEVRSCRPGPCCVLHTHRRSTAAQRFHVVEKGVPTPTSRAVVAALLDDA